MKPNHLAGEQSPYLLQHAHNPVDWHPWGEEAFAKARREEKPILLSIGYSTCHWCHVMERESFSDPDIASVMNAHFVSIKVDREERPDVDKIYMTAVQAMTGQGGWPLNVFLTPELKPFFGGTYFPPSARWGQPGFPQLLARIAELWGSKRAEIGADAARMEAALRAYAAAEAGKTPLEAAWLDAAFEAYRGAFDPRFGGFGGAPKFPMPVNQGFLLRYHARTGKKEALDLALKTLRAMAAGGLCDQVGGGFHRYSTDAEWHVPHFEKMLYDNAQLAVNFLEAYQVSREELFARVARETLGYLLRDMRDPEGGFYSAEDADSLPQELAAKGIPDEGHAHKVEGAFYAWSEGELREVLGDSAGAFIHRYGAEPGGNVDSDPHGEFEGKNILFLKHTLAETAAESGAKAAAMEKLLDSARTRLLKARSERPRPGLDDKVLTSWNGLAISAFAKASAILDDPAYLEAARKAAAFLRDHLYDPKERRLYHRWRKGDRAVAGLADDYAFLVQGLIDLYEASGEPEWLAWAVSLAEEQDRLFGAEGGGYYMTAEGHDKNLLVRVIEDNDNVEPSASSVGALNLQRLAQLAQREDFRQAAEKTLERFGAQMRERPMALAQMLAAADLALSKPRQIVIAGDPQAPATRALLREVRARFLPGAVLILADERSRPALAKLAPFLAGLAPVNGKPAAYVCVDHACRLPVTEPKALGELLDGPPEAEGALQ